MQCSDRLELLLLVKGFSGRPTPWNEFFQQVGEHKSQLEIVKESLSLRRCEARLQFFSQQVINHWNSLSQEDVECNTSERVQRTSAEKASQSAPSGASILDLGARSPRCWPIPSPTFPISLPSLVLFSPPFRGKNPLTPSSPPFSLPRPCKQGSGGFSPGKIFQI